MNGELFWPTLIVTLIVCCYCYQRGFEKGKSECRENKPEWTEQDIRTLIREELNIRGSEKNE